LSAKTARWIVTSDSVRIRLDQFLIRLNPGESRSQIQNWIRKGLLRVNGHQVKTGYLTRLNDRIELHAPESYPDQPFPEAIPLDILYEDSDLAVINKPAGMVCHTGAGIRSGTLVNALLHHLGPLEAGDPQRPGIVHRLDKLTSGVMLAAKNGLAHRQLSRQFKNRQVQKEYVAMVYGRPAPAAGTIDMPLGRDPKDRKKISIRARKARSAITHYTVTETCGPVSLLRIQIETGRTHQIRVHLAQKGHPIVGDSVYGANRARDLPGRISAAVRELQRPFLHSQRIEFRHPRSGEWLSFSAPLPPELLKFLSAIRKQNAMRENRKSRE
jgi:23S rRNA pseudouridine1911/1915/1917 synthase